jgi:Predicted AAA-ATPase/PD-(D/E)XK nuclease superfamily
MRLPIGIQDFAKLREGNYVYVDKTMHVKTFLQGGLFFLARPRRFGKSLLLSVLKYAFEGRKDLFNGLWLEENFDFKACPVIRLDFSRLDFFARTLEAALVDSFQQTAKEHGLTLQANTPKSAFEELILELSKTQKVVILVDEYDKAITDVLFDQKQRDAHQIILKSVYGVLKSLDEHLHTVFITGVSKIGKLSLFSDLNNIQDISLDPEFATVCGYTKTEIEHSFPTYLEKAALVFNVPTSALWDAIQFWYNGYSWDAINKVYCPFSFLLFLSNPEFKSHWYETGSPSFLIEMIRDAQIDPLEFEFRNADSMQLVATDVENIDPVGLMFQTGYLTIVNKRNKMTGIEYDLAYPNQEVRMAFSRGLLENYTAKYPSFIGTFAFELRSLLLKNDWDASFFKVNQILAGIPYEIFPRQETYVHSLIHLMLVSTGLRVQSQVQTSTGRIDTVIEMPDQFIILEFKIGGTSETALQQIIDKDYAAGFSSKPVVGVGVVFDLETKSLVSWKAQSLTRD